MMAVALAILSSGAQQLFGSLKGNKRINGPKKVWIWSDV